MFGYWFGLFEYLVRHVVDLLFKSPIPAATGPSLRMVRRR